MLFLEAWGTKAKKQMCLQEETVFVGLAAFGGQAKQTSRFLKKCGSLAVVPQASKTHLANTTLWDPSEI